MGGCMSSPSKSPAHAAPQNHAHAHTRRPSGDTISVREMRRSSTRQSHRTEHVRVMSHRSSLSIMSPAPGPCQSDLSIHATGDRQRSVSCTTAQDTDSGYQSDHHLHSRQIRQTDPQSYFALHKSPSSNTEEPPTSPFDSMSSPHHTGKHTSTCPSTIDWSPSSPNTSHASSINGPVTLTSAFEGMDDIDVDDNPIEHVLPPEAPKTAFGRRLARRAELTTHIMTGGSVHGRPDIGSKAKIDAVVAGAMRP